MVVTTSLQNATLQRPRISILGCIKIGFVLPLQAMTIYTYSGLKDTMFSVRQRVTFMFSFPVLWLRLPNGTPSYSFAHSEGSDDLLAVKSPMFEQLLLCCSRSTRKVHIIYSSNDSRFTGTRFRENSRKSQSFCFYTHVSFTSSSTVTSVQTSAPKS